MHRQCQFCRILHQQTQAILYRDGIMFAFHDIDKSSAKEHVLVCTNQHIETAEDIVDIDTLLRMRQVGTKVLDKLCQGDKNEERNYRFGFHLRPYNSIDHVHLHCFVLPFSSFVKDRIVYGKMMTSIQEVIQRISRKPTAKF